MCRLHTTACLCFVFSAFPLAGCKNEPIHQPDPAGQAAAVAQLTVAGPWSQPVAGLQCHIRLQSSQTIETGSLSVAMVIENATDKDVVLRATGSPPFGPENLRWFVGNVTASTIPVSVSAPAPETRLLRLSPGEQLVIDERLVIPPGPGELPLSASFTSADGLTLIAPPVTLHVAEAPWGPPSNGVRLRLSSSIFRYRVGDPLLLNAFLQNLDHNPLVARPIDWATLKINIRRELIVLQATTLDAQPITVPRNAAWGTAVPTSLMLAPGTYRLRIEIDSPELSVTHTPAWHGLVVSNEQTIEVVAK